jgi:hypothetical protein
MFGAIVSGLSRKWVKWPWFRGRGSPRRGASQPAAALAGSPHASRHAAATITDCHTGAVALWTLSPRRKSSSFRNSIGPFPYNGLRRCET